MADYYYRIKIFLLYLTKIYIFPFFFQIDFIVKNSFSINKHIKNIKIKLFQLF